MTALARRSRSAQGMLAFGLYLVAAFAMFGWPVVASPSRSYIGANHPDVASSIWFLGWWPHALARGLDPFHPHLIWYPSGVDLAWRAGLPGPSLLTAPLTALAGPVTSYNLLTLLSPALAAWATYLLCRAVTERFGPSLVGGWVFGFSSFELGHLRNHLNVALIFPVPLMAYLAVRRLQGTLGDGAFVPAMAATVVVLFSIFTETFLLASIVGTVVVLLSARRTTGDRRRRWEELFRSSIAAYGIAVIVLAPYLYDAVRHRPHQRLHLASDNSTDLLNFVTPTHLTLLGSHMNVPNISEAVGYLGLPLIAVMVLFALERRHRPGTVLLVGTVLVLCVLSLGPVLHINNHRHGSLPWTLIDSAPVLEDVLPVRLMLYAWLAGAVMVAMWLSLQRWLRPVAKWVLAVLVVVALFPNLPSLDRYWHTPVAVPAFFTAGDYRGYLGPGDTALVIPYAQCGRSMLWQAETHWHFAVAEGYVGSDVPMPFRLRVVEAFYSGRAYAGVDEDVRRFLGDHEVKAVIVADGTVGQWDQLFGSLGRAVHDGGVTVYRVPPPVLARYRAGAGGPETGVNDSGFPGCSM